MNGSTVNLCAICGEERSGNETRFLIAENRWEDKLTVLQWNEQIAARYGIQVACSVSHAEELVIHWMTTGSLDYPFARTALGAGGGDSLLCQAGALISAARVRSANWPYIGRAWNVSLRRAHNL